MERFLSSFSSNFSAISWLEQVKKSLKIPKGQSESVYLRRDDDEICFMRLEPLISHTGILTTFYLSIILDLQNFFH